MKLINSLTGRVLSTVIGGEGLTLDQAIELAGGEIINDSRDPRWEDFGGNVILNGERYYYEDLDYCVED